MIINSNKARTIGEISLKKGKNEVEFETNGDLEEFRIEATEFLICEAITFGEDKVSSYIPEDNIDDSEVEPTL